MVFMHGLEFADNRFGEAQAAFARCLTADLPSNADFSALERAALISSPPCKRPPMLKPAR
jgi:hypothetical protein